MSSIIFALGCTLCEKKVYTEFEFLGNEKVDQKQKQNLILIQFV